MMASQPAIYIFLQACLILSCHTRHVPFNSDDLVIDSLMPVNTTKIHKNRVERQLYSSEGSGQGAIPIESLPSNIGMQRLMVEPANEDVEEDNKKAIVPDLVDIQNEEQDDKSREDVESHDVGPAPLESLHDIDEGSGASEKDEEVEVPKTAAILSDIDDPFKKEDGMEKVLEDLAGATSKQLDTDDNNKQDNALSVLGGEDDLTVKTSDENLHESTEEQEIEGSGAPVVALPAMPIVQDGKEKVSEDGEKDNEEKNNDTEQHKNVSGQNGGEKASGEEGEKEDEENNNDAEQNLKNVPGQDGEENTDGGNDEKYDEEKNNNAEQNLKNVPGNEENEGNDKDEEINSDTENIEIGHEEGNESDKVLVPVSTDESEEGAEVTEAAEVGANVVSKEDTEKIQEQQRTSDEEVHNTMNSQSSVEIDDDKNERQNENEATSSPDSEQEERNAENEDISLLAETDYPLKEYERAGKMIVLMNDTDSDEEVREGDVNTQVPPEEVQSTTIATDEGDTDQEQGETEEDTLLPTVSETALSTEEIFETTTEADQSAETTTVQEAPIAVEPVSTEINFSVDGSTTETVLSVEASSTTEASISAEISSTESSTESSSTVEIETGKNIEISTESATQTTETSTEAETEESTTLEVIVESVGVLVETAIKEKITNSEDNMQSAGSTEEKSLGAYILIGLLAVCFLALIAFLVLRKRSKTQKARLDNNQERDPEKAHLGNGKYKEESDDNNVKNNEITPLVIKQNSQINKFEKNPNFSSPKNLNTTVNEKNIEKDNVLKSTQAIIEEDEDAKKALEEEKKPEEETDGVDDEKKALMGENSPTEKVIVRTHVDQDSIPKKPVLVTRNGNGYHAVSQDPV